MLFNSVLVPSFYQDIADATGGEVYRTSKSELGNILNKVLEVYLTFRTKLHNPVYCFIICLVINTISSNILAISW